ncbi:hypothetical protein P692DRAFT_20605711 [Suillus brevipes Sb2]|nr:hypothetical protein P692DRAFT_20605711 [Suillus brevipes Sb2]
MEVMSLFRGRVASSLSDSCLLRVMGLNNMGNALVACCRIPDGSDIEGNINVITLHAAVKSRARSDCVTTSSTLHCKRGVIIPNETDLAVGSRPTVTLFESFENVKGCLCGFKELTLTLQRLTSQCFIVNKRSVGNTRGELCICYHTLRYWLCVS